MWNLTVLEIKPVSPALAGRVLTTGLPGRSFTYILCLYFHLLTTHPVPCQNKIMASGPITSWHIDGEKVETVTDFLFLGSKITVDSDCGHKIKRRLLLGRKAMTNLDSILKSRDITLLMKVHIVKAIVFPVVMYGFECWTVKKAEHWKTDAFELCC